MGIRDAATRKRVRLAGDTAPVEEGCVAGDIRVDDRAAVPTELPRIKTHATPISQIAAPAGSDVPPGSRTREDSRWAGSGIRDSLDYERAYK